MNANTVVDDGLKRARSAKAKLLKLVGGVDPNAAVGISREGVNYVLKVNSQKPLHDASLPTQIDGVPIKNEFVGRIRKQ